MHRLSSGTTTRSAPEQRVDNGDSDQHDRRGDRHPAPDGAFVCGPPGLPCSPALLERRRLRDRNGCRDAWWRDNSGYGGGHVPLTPEGFGEGWARMAEGSEKQQPYPIRLSSTPLDFFRNAALSTRAS